MKTALVLGLAALSMVALGKPSAQNGKQGRVDAIWETAENRMRHQIDVWFDNGDYPRCIQTLKLLAKADPADYETQTDLGWMLENVERYDEALAVYVHYRKSFPSLPDAAFPEANFYFMKRA